jgi:GNAT superfamily N-acetyltransferase
MTLEIRPLHTAPEARAVIVEWYAAEWRMPVARIEALLDSMSPNGTPMQSVCYRDGLIVGTAGIYNQVGLFQTAPHFAELQPWLALVYTPPELRGAGIASWLCSRMDDEARRLGFSRYYLFTFTAESLYRRLGWVEMDRVDYHGHDAAVMYKDL